MRITINQLVKVFAIILFIVFVGPSILSFFERPSGEEGYKKHRREKHHNDVPKGPNMDIPPKKTQTNKIPGHPGPEGDLQNPIGGMVSLHSFLIMSAYHFSQFI